MTKMRAKMQISHITQHQNCEVLELNAVCKSGSYTDDGSDEDNTYAKFTPSGKLTLTVANPALIGQFKPGQKFYLDFTLAEDKPAA